jgi:hypothetical protein
VFHHDEQLIVNFLDGVDGGDVGMVQGGSRLRFDFETLAFFLAGGNLSRQEFDGNEALEPGVLGFLPRETTSLKSPWNPSVFYLTG